MENMDLLPPTAPSLVFARETYTPYCAYHHEDTSYTYRGLYCAYHHMDTSYTYRNQYCAHHHGDTSYTYRGLYCAYHPIIVRIYVILIEVSVVLIITRIQITLI